MQMNFFAKVALLSISLVTLIYVLPSIESTSQLLAITETTPQTLEPRHVPARVIPVPSTVSQQLQELDTKQFNPNPNLSPTTNLEWYGLIEYHTRMSGNTAFDKAKKLFPVIIKKESLAGVTVYTAEPESIPLENKDFILLYVHGGGYILYGGKNSLPEAMALAHYGNFKVVSVDYRMPPAYPFPIGLNDSVEVYKELLKTYQPKNIGIFGTSAGGGLAAALVLKLNELHLPLPGVLGLATPWADLTKTGDTYFTNQDIDNVLVQYQGIMEATAKLYADGHDLKDPYISPIYGEYTKEFPPTILTSGTRDLFLSNTVRLFRKMRQASVKAELQVFEGAPHAFHVIGVDSPEAHEAYQEMVLFFNEHLGK